MSNHRHQYPNNLSPIYSGKICPYCSKETEFVDSAEVYQISYGMIYLCRDCQAWVGVHEGTDKALGRLANEELREWKKKAHRTFDPIAKGGLIKKIFPKYLSSTSVREKAYMWLAEHMGIKREYCHIGMFDVEECKQVISICEMALLKYL